MEILKIYKPKNFIAENPILVHLHSSKAGILGRIACRLLRIRFYIYTPHCGAFLRTDISAAKRKLYWFFEWVGSLFGGRVVGCGPSEGELYKRLGKNTCYVSNGVALKEAGHIGSKAGSRNLISFIGLASFQKDPALWSDIASASAGFAREKSFSFYWIGDGPEAALLNRDCLDLSGWKSAEEVEDLLNNTAIFLSAAAWEGLPYGVLEAMSSGCALLLRNVPGNRDLVIPGENGWLFNSKDEAVERLKEMLNDRERISAMGKRSREILETGFTLRQMGEGYRKIYSGCFRGEI
jgi:glycosyltransferase involved in cell wall biosynthesis